MERLLLLNLSGYNTCDIHTTYNDTLFTVIQVISKLIFWGSRAILNLCLYLQNATNTTSGKMLERLRIIPGIALFKESYTSDVWKSSPGVHPFPIKKTFYEIVSAKPKPTQTSAFFLYELKIRSRPKR